MFGETSNPQRKGIITLNHLEDRHNCIVRINNKTLGSNKKKLIFFPPHSIVSATERINF